MTSQEMARVTEVTQQPGMSGFAGLNLEGTLGVQVLLRNVPEGLPFAALQDPFLTLPSPDPLTRWLAGRLVTDAGTELQRATLVLLSDRFSDEPLLPVTNPEVEGLWREECDALLRLGANGPGLVPLAAYLDTEGAPRKHRPLFFCKHLRELFCPPCPRCGGPLTECRKDDVLAQAGLVPFSQGSRRYLWCPSCEAPEGGAAFYVRDVTAAERVKPRLTDLSGLVRLWTSLVKDNKVQGDFPCPLCPESAKCYGNAVPVRAEGLLTPLAFYDFFLFVRGYFPLDLAAAGDLLGGRTVDDLLAQARSARNPAQEQAACDLALRLKSQPLYVTGAGTTQSALEVFKAKVGLWLQAVGQARRAWEACRHPLVTLAPEAFGVDYLPEGPALPLSLSLRARLCVLSRAVVRFQGEAAGVARPLFALNRAYLCPELATSGEASLGRFLVEGHEPGVSPGQYVLRGRLGLGPRQMPGPWEGSRFLCSFGRAHGLSRELQATFVASGAEGAMVLVRSYPVELDEQETSLFRLLATQPPFDIEYQRLPQSQVSADLFSLGLIGARLLLVNARQGIEDVLRAVLELRSALGSGARAGSGVSGKAIGGPDAWLSGEVERRPVLSPYNIHYYQAGDSQADVLPKGLWDETIKVLLRMVSSGTAFGYEGFGGEGADVFGIAEEGLRALLLRAAEASGVPEDVVMVPRNDALASILDMLLSDPQWLGQAPVQDLPLREAAHAPPLRPVAPKEPPQAAGLEETVILGPEGARPPGPIRLSEEPLEQTVVLSPRQVGGGVVKDAGVSAQEEDLEATVVITRKG